MSGLGDRPRAAGWLTALAGASILGWAVPALLMLGKGFAVQDEGSYVLSYRFWRSDPYFESGSQYILGPLFEALGESIPLLRLFRLLVVLGANLGFAWAFLAWLERQGRPLPASRPGLLLLVTAAGGMSYLWAPLTPGYYDLTADCTLALVAMTLSTLARGRAATAWVPVASGVVGVVLVATKWPAVLVLAVCCGVAAAGQSRLGVRVALRYLALVVAGAVAALVACQLLLVPVGRVVTTMSRVSSLTAVSNHSASYLARQNAASSLVFLLGALVLGIPLLLGLLAAWMLARRGRGGLARGAVLGAAAFTVVVVPLAAGWLGGNGRGRVVVSIALAGLCAALLAALWTGPRPFLATRQSRWVAALLFVVPLLQAAGTNVPLVYVAAECLAMWVALPLLVVARPGTTGPAHLDATAVLANLGVVVVATALIAGTTTLQTPFKTTGLTADHVRVPGLGVSLSPAVARQDAALRSALSSYVVPGVTPVFAMDENAGLVYLLGGVPVGSTWNDAASPTRTAGILELACRDGGVARSRRPVLLLTRAVDRHVAAAMARCGFGFPQGYRRLAVPGGPPGTRVLVPRQGS